MAVFTDNDYGYLEFYNSIDTILMGRKTYDKALEFEEHPFMVKRAMYSARIPLLRIKIKM